MFKSLFTSKKFVTALVSTIAAALATQGYNMPVDTVMAMLTPIMAYVVGQGIADNGKEKAKIEASNTA